MSVGEALINLFKPKFEPEILPIRMMSIAVGAIGTIAAIAAAVFGSLSAGAAAVLAAFSAVMILGGAIGSIGLIVLPLIIGLGIAFATPIAYGGGYAVVLI